MKHLVPALLMLCTAGAAAAADPDHDALIARGEQVFAYNCTSCHGPGIGNPGNEFKPGTDALRVKYNGDVPALLTERTDLTPDAVAYFVRNGISIMPFFRKTEISDADLAALGAYLNRNSAGR
ncbi:cytochrome c (plasmid) [Roseomonas mucosa]|uniref:c-type cytochrome n=1 Tax=Roseomonas TaxID=125216 RepID=UPI000C181F47|nr:MULTISPECIES: cytochrome c [Roseomonas]MDT8264868.1 cytochrome c [Roseomonas sp. DSM 102946]USQ73865.1 cytochrome c [Roseomonas mucosa]